MIQQSVAVTALLLIYSAAPSVPEMLPVNAVPVIFPVTFPLALRFTAPPAAVALLPENRESETAMSPVMA